MTVSGKLQYFHAKSFIIPIIVNCFGKILLTFHLSIVRKIFLSFNQQLFHKKSTHGV